jgi:hypothetical protein
MLTCDITPTKQIKLNMPVSKPNGRQRDPDAFRLMWHNREVYICQRAKTNRSELEPTF